MYACLKVFLSQRTASSQCPELAKNRAEHIRFHAKTGKCELGIGL